MTTRFCLVRHGETAWNAEHRIQGQSDIPLNAAGRHQAAAAGQKLRSAGVDFLYGSDLLRAWATAQIIGEALGLSPIAAPEMRERRYGLAEGLTLAELQHKHPESHAAMQARHPDYDFETGESLRQVYTRVSAKLESLATAHPGKTLVIVVHGGVLDAANRFVRGTPLETPRDFLVPNAGLNWIRCTEGTWTIEAWGSGEDCAEGGRGKREGQKRLSGGVKGEK